MFYSTGERLLEFDSPLKTFIMSLSYIAGGLLITHAAYSSYEHHQFLKSATAIPLDIVLELIIGLILLNFGALESITNGPRLGITHSNLVKHPKIYLRPIEMSQAMESINSLGVSEFEELDSRVDFLDVRQKRKEYMEWAGKN